MNEKELSEEKIKESTIKKIYNEIKMRRISLVFFSLIISIVITYLVTNITFYVQPEISKSPDSYDQVHGFPFEVERGFSPQTVILNPVPKDFISPSNPYFLTFLFWFSGSLTFLLLLQRPKWKRLLIFICVIALLLMWIEIKTDDSCLIGYPIRFFSVCTDLAIPNNQFWFFAMLDYSFWAVIALVGTFVFLHVYKSRYRKVRLFVPPLILTFYSLVYYTSCAGFLFCFFEGRGFPISFIRSENIYGGAFGINYVFWWIAYNFVIFVIFIKRQIKHNRASQISPQITSIASKKDILEEKS